MKEPYITLKRDLLTLLRRSGMALSEASGLSTTDLLDVLDNGAMSNPMFRMKGPNMAVSFSAGELRRAGMAEFRV